MAPWYCDDMTTRQIDQLNYDYWVTDMTVRTATLDVFRLEEEMAFEAMKRYAETDGLAPKDLVGPWPMMNWYDMEDPIHYRYIYGDRSNLPTFVPPLKPPARWLLRAFWNVRQPN